MNYAFIIRNIHIRRVPSIKQNKIIIVIIYSRKTQLFTGKRKRRENPG